MKVERRFANGQLELRHFGGKPTIVGRAASYNVRSRLMVAYGGPFYEEISPGAFTKSLMRNDDVRALVDHDPSKILGRTTAGTLTLREGADGLYCEINPPDTTAGRDVVESVKRGDLDNMSFGFTVPDGGDTWDRTADGFNLRTLQEVQLADVSIVAYPAYPATSVAMRSLLFPDGLPVGIERRIGVSSDRQQPHSGQPGAFLGDRERQLARIALLRRLVR